MNKRGFAILLLSAIGFLVAVMLFFSTVDKLQVVGNSTYLGESEVDVLSAYIEGEELVVFLENAARRSSVEDDFSSSFSSYIAKANKIFGLDMSVNDFEITKDKSFVKAVATKGFILEKGNAKYSVIPSFIVYL